MFIAATIILTDILVAHSCICMSLVNHDIHPCRAPVAGIGCSHCTVIKKLPLLIYCVLHNCDSLSRCRNMLYHQLQVVFRFGTLRTFANGPECQIPFREVCTCLVSSCATTVSFFFALLFCHHTPSEPITPETHTDGVSQIKHQAYMPRMQPRPFEQDGYGVVLEMDTGMMSHQRQDPTTLDSTYMFFSNPGDMYM